MFIMHESKNYKTLPKKISVHTPDFTLTDTNSVNQYNGSGRCLEN